jgi:hypothetical protein
MRTEKENHKVICQQCERVWFEVDPPEMDTPCPFCEVKKLKETLKASRVSAAAWRERWVEDTDKHAEEVKSLRHTAKEWKEKATKKIVKKHPDGFSLGKKPCGTCDIYPGDSRCLKCPHYDGA